MTASPQTIVGHREQPVRPIYVGCAGWSIPREHSSHFPSEGSHLERYAGRLSAVEINSSFYRPHQPKTYARWAQSVPEGFRFAVKMPREITHQRRLKDGNELLARFLGECSALGEKLGPLLVQLPASLAFDPGTASAFFARLRERSLAKIVCEPRHPSWFSQEAEHILSDYQVARAAADPAPVPEATHPGGWGELFYFRWHGSPQIYYSTYSDEALAALAQEIHPASTSAEVWCIFDNTALGAATANALALLEHHSIKIS